jgi:hypothetical protein
VLTLLLGASLVGSAAAAIPAPPVVPVPPVTDGASPQGGAVRRTSHKLDATYDVSVDIGWASRSVRVDTRIDMVNTSGGPIARLELNTTAPVRGAMRLHRVLVDGDEVHSVEVTGQTIVVLLPQTLQVGADLTVRVVYTGRASFGTADSQWMWSRDNNVLSLYRFIPWISRQLRFERPNHGDPFMTPSSREVRVRLTADRQLTYATSGERLSTNGLTQTFVARNVRDFNVTASPDYDVRSRQTADGDTVVRVFTRHGRAELVMTWALKSLKAYEDWVGEYPWPVFNVAESSGGYAMESPALIWLPMTQFTDDQVKYLVAHETGHQWFYAAVGNDQTTNMFADEAMTDFLARTLTNRLRGSYCGKDRFDKPLYDYGETCYFEVIYIQGSRWIDDLRKDMGNERFWAVVRRYYADNLHKLSNDRRLLEAFRSEAGDWVVPRYRKRFPSLYHGCCCGACSMAAALAPAA